MHKGGKKPVKCMKIDAKTKKVVKVYPSIAEAVRENLVSISCIKAALTGKQKTCLGYIWIKE